MLISGSAVYAAPVSDLSQGQTGLIEFESITPTNIYHFLKNKEQPQNAPKATITGELALPAGTGLADIGVEASWLNTASQEGY